MGTRLQLHQLLRDTLGNAHVYFQPPANISMVYPCIVYRRAHHRTRFADNSPYFHCKQYEVTVMDKDPDSLIPDKVATLPMCLFDRYYTADNINHDVYILYF